MEEEPSRVLHLRNVTSEVTHADLTALCQPFGKVENIVMLREKNQALVQMDSIATATACINFHTSGHAEVNGRRVYMKYSRHSELAGKAGQPGAIILASMSNPLYNIASVIPITAELLYQVFSPYGKVTKIVVIQKETGENRKQALIQFDSHESAEAAKGYLQGQNVYIGTSVYFLLDLQYSNLEELQIKNNGPSAMSFENGPPDSVAQQQALMQQYQQMQQDPQMQAAQMAAYQQYQQQMMQMMAAGAPPAGPPAGPPQWQ